MASGVNGSNDTRGIVPARAPRGDGFVPSGREPLEPLDRFEVFLDEAVDHLAHRPHGIHAAHDLPDGVEHHVLRLVGVAVPARDGLGGHHELERHAEGLRGIGRLPRLGPGVAQHAAGLAGERPRAHGVAARRLEILLDLGGGGVGLLHGEPDRAGPHPLRAHREPSRNLPPRPDAASTGVGATASTTSGQSTTLPISPVCPPPSVPWAITMSTPAALCARACFSDPHSAATSRPASWISPMTSGGGVPSAFATSRTCSCRSATSSCGAAVAIVQPSSSLTGFSSGGSLGTPWRASSSSTNARCCGGIAARSCASSFCGSSSPIPSYFPGITMSTP